MKTQVGQDIDTIGAVARTAAADPSALKPEDVFAVCRLALIGIGIRPEALDDLLTPETVAVESTKYMLTLTHGEYALLQYALARMIETAVDDNAHGDNTEPIGTALGIQTAKDLYLKIAGVPWEPGPAVKPRDHYAWNEENGPDTFTVGDRVLLFDRDCVVTHVDKGQIPAMVSVQFIDGDMDVVSPECLTIVGD